MSRGRAYADSGSDVTTLCIQDSGASSMASARISIIGHLADQAP
jgi:hypothetical protein